MQTRPKSCGECSEKSRVFSGLPFAKKWKGKLACYLTGELILYLTKRGKECPLGGEDIPHDGPFYYGEEY
jgi:hypothetical protein